MLIPYLFAKKADKVKRNIAEKFYEMNTRNRKRAQLQALEKWCEENLSSINEKAYRYKDVVCAQPEELLELTKHITPKRDNEENDDSIKYLLDNLYENMTQDALNYLYETVGTKVCPYCNRNYVYVDGRVKGCDFDHYIPKSQYPILAASFYNLIPACPVCNRFKKDRILNFYPHSKYDYDNLPHFRVWIKADDYRTNAESIEIEIDSSNCPDFEDDIKHLKLKTLYQSHRDTVQEVLICKEVYSDSYLNELASNFESYGLTKDRMREIIYDIPSSPERFSEKPLSKLRYEVWYMDENDDLN